MALPHVAVGWSAVCDCGISWSYSLIFYIAPNVQLYLGYVLAPLTRCFPVQLVIITLRKREDELICLLYALLYGGMLFCWCSWF